MRWSAVVCGAGLDTGWAPVFLSGGVLAWHESPPKKHAEFALLQFEGGENRPDEVVGQLIVEGDDSGSLAAGAFPGFVTSLDAIRSGPLRAEELDEIASLDDQSAGDEGALWKRKGRLDVEGAPQTLSEPASDLRRRFDAGGLGEHLHARFFENLVKGSHSGRGFEKETDRLDCGGFGLLRGFTLGVNL